MRRNFFLAVFLGMCCSASSALSKDAGDTDAAIQRAHRWFESAFEDDSRDLPFRFQLGEEDSAEVLARSESRTETEKLDGNRSRVTKTWTDETTGLETKVVAIKYADFPNVEWTVHFKNTSAEATPVLSDVAAVDMTQPLPAGAGAVLHHQKGSNAAPNDYEPYETPLEEGASLEYRAAGGRGTNGDWPYFNAHWDEQGLIFVMGWPGQWALTVERNEKGELDLSGGQERTHFKLSPGEEARTPLIVLQWYDGDWVTGQNIWRRWFVAYNLPRPDGELPPPQMVACSSHQFNEMLNANEENQKHFIDRYLEEEFPLDYWWMDAGWYPNDGTWVTTGTWEVDKTRFPNGLRAVTDYGREKGVKSIVWFEPERVAPNSWLYENRPEWLLTPPPNPGGQAYDDRWRLFNLANPEAREWLIQHVSDLIESEGIDLYRQDFNIDPLMFWQEGEADDRQGITENHYVTGYLAYWDALLESHPKLRIDSCASGGRRNDLETLRRSVPLLRSDYLFEPSGQQAHHYGLSLWVPYHGTGTLAGKSAIGLNTDEGVKQYDFRSHMSPSLNTAWDLRDENMDYDKMRRLIGEFKTVSPLYLGDFYPLTPYSLSSDAWMAWQYNDPQQGKAFVQAFRREDNEAPEMALMLRGLDAQATYLIEPLGGGDAWTASGTELMEDGLEARLPDKRSAGLYLLTKKGSATGG